MSSEHLSVDQTAVEAFGLITEAEARALDEIKEVPGARHSSATEADMAIATLLMKAIQRR